MRKVVSVCLRYHIAIYTSIEGIHIYAGVLLKACNATLPHLYSGSRILPVPAALVEL